jgi:hypothetical protein
MPFNQYALLMLMHVMGDNSWHHDDWNLHLYDNAVDWTDHNNPTPTPHEPTWSGYSPQPLTNWTDSQWSVLYVSAFEATTDLVIWTYGGDGTDPDLVGFYITDGINNFVGGDGFAGGPIRLQFNGQIVPVQPQIYLYG